MGLCNRNELKVYASIFCALMGLVFTWFMSWDCRFFRAAEPIDNTPLIVERGFGLWTVTDVPNLPVSRASTKCVLYTVAEPPLDGALRFAQFTSMVALIMSIPLAIVISTNLRRTSRRAIHRQACFMLVTVVLLLLSFTAMASHHCNNADQCYLGPAGYYGIWAILFWLLSALWLCRIQVVDFAEYATGIERAPAPTGKFANDDEERPTVVVVEITEDDDEEDDFTAAATAGRPSVRVERRSLTGGRTEITTTKQHPDGSTTVTLQVLNDNELMDVAL